MSRSNVVRSSSAEVREMVVPARPRQHLHQLDRRPQEVVQAVRGLVDRQPGPQVWLLRRDADRDSCSVWHARMPRQPMAWIALLAMATASAPSASALAKSDGVAQTAGDDRA